MFLYGQGWTKEPSPCPQGGRQGIDLTGLVSGEKINSQEGLESDTINKINNFSKEGELHGEGKAESRRDFLARMHDGTQRVGEVGEIAYSYVPVSFVDASKQAQEAEVELRALGIECFFHDGLEYNLDEESHSDCGEAATIGQKIVAIYKDATTSGKEIAGHEFIHVKMGTPGRMAFEQVFRENINMLSVYAIKQGDVVLKNYLGGELTDKSTFFEEFLGRICGQIHSGEDDADLRTMFRDFDAVKTAWEDFVKEWRQGNG